MYASTQGVGIKTPYPNLANSCQSISEHIAQRTVGTYFRHCRSTVHGAIVDSSQILLPANRLARIMLPTMDLVSSWPRIVYIVCGTISPGIRAD